MSTLISTQIYKYFQINVNENPKDIFSWEVNDPRTNYTMQYAQNLAGPSVALEQAQAYIDAHPVTVATNAMAAALASSGLAATAIESILNIGLTVSVAITAEKENLEQIHEQEPFV